MQLPDSVRRAIRTFVQAFTGVILAQVGAIALDLADGTYVIDVNWWKRVLVSAAISGVVAIVSFLQNWAEDARAVPSVLKATASSGANPVTRDPSGVSPNPS